MTIAQKIEKSQQDIEEIQYPPSDLESQEPPLESYLHLQQLLLLLKCLDWLWKDREDYFSAGNLSIYYSQTQDKSEDFRGPDFFVVLNTERQPRKSWVVWEEGGKYPHVIIELLSSSTAKIDRTDKKEIYQDIFRTPDYFWFSPDTLEFQGFHLVDGEYQEIYPNEQGWRWSQQLQLFLGVYEQQLRFFNPEGVLVSTPEEAAKTAQEQLELERQQKEKLVNKLRELNIDPDTLF
ncbi:MAG: Uma2 family endonuclease [Cyanobacteriota bacterium]|nr:Uma2 family endonuclease [Cyanobacteriota bacterium]